MNSIITSQGSTATNLKATLTAASLDWEPMADKVAGMDTGIQMPGKKLLYRSDNKQALGVVGEDYQPTQPREFLKAGFELAEFLKGKVTRAGFLASRARAFTFISIGEELVIPKGVRKVGDPMRAYIYSTDGWDGGTPRRSRLYIERLRCLNGNVSSEIKSNLWVSHTSNLETNYTLRLKGFRETVQAETARIMAEFTQLAKTRMDSKEMAEFLVKLMPGEGGRVEGRREEVAKLFVTEATGNEGVSRWDAYNAVTEYVTHQRTYRKTEAVSAEVNRFLGVLETDTLAKKALELLAN